MFSKHIAVHSSVLQLPKGTAHVLETAALELPLGNGITSFCCQSCHFDYPVGLMETKYTQKVEGLRSTILSDK